MTSLEGAQGYVCLRVMSRGSVVVVGAIPPCLLLMP